MAFLDDVAADLEDVFLTDFAVSATLAGRPVRVIFEAAAAERDGMIATDPIAQLPTASVPEPIVGKLLVVALGGGVFGNYAVRSHQPDGTGMSTLVLARTAGG